MDSKDLIKLARIFDSFIELDSSRVRIQDIVAVQKVGVFLDSTDYDTFNTRIKDTLELIKENDRRAEIVQEALQNPVSATPQPAGVAKVKQIEQSERKVVQLQTSAEAAARQTTINVGPQGAQGKLFSDPAIQLGDRANLLVLDPTGQMVLGRAGEGSAITGEKVSGFIYNNGKYVLTFKEYPHKEAKVSYAIVKRPSV